MGKGRSAITVMPNCPIPKLLPYNKLVKEINQVIIGNVYKVEVQFQGVLEDETTQGCFLKLIEYLPRLAKFYLRKKKRKPFTGLAKLRVLFYLQWVGMAAHLGKMRVHVPFC